MEVRHLTPHITEIRVPFFDIYTKVFLVRTPAGNLLFDTATYPTDITDIVLPVLAAEGVGAADLFCVFISHPHRDHAGGLGELLTLCPDITVVAGGEGLKGDHPGAHLIALGDGAPLLDVLQVVAIPGHTSDAIALLDTRTGTLLSGDCLQLYGIFGSGWWGANINYPKAHLAALDRLLTLQITEIYPAHDYHPVGDAFIGREEILRAVAACREPLLMIRDMIQNAPEADDKAIAARYNAQALPTLGPHVVTAVRRDLV